MRLNKLEEDLGKDLKVGDTVWIKGVVDQLPIEYGDVKVRYFARPSVNAIFLRRSKLNWLRRLFKK